MKRLKWFKQLLGHRYFNRIFYMSISSLILLIVIATLAFYLYIDKSVSQNKYDTDMETLLQIHKNFESTTKLINSFCRKIYFSASSGDIMYNKPGNLKWKDIEDTLKGISSDMTSFTPYIHSVYIYNNYSKIYYSAYGDAQMNAADIKDVYMQKAIHQFNNVPKLTPVLRKIKTNNPETIEYEDVLTYFLYETTDENSYFNGAVIVNIEPEWLLDNLDNLNPDKNYRFFLMASSREFVNVDNNISYKYLDDLTTVYFNIVRNKISKGIESDMVPCYLDGEKNILSYIYLKNEDFILYKIQTYNSVYGSVKRVKITLLIISAAIIIISLFLAFFMVENIYRPFENLVKNISRYSGNGNNGYGHFDELRFLENSYINSVDEISLLKKEINSAESIKYKYYLTQLLLNSNTVTDSEIKDIGNSGLFHVNMSYTLTLIILKLDFKSTNETAAQDISTWMKNTFSNDLRSYYVNDVIDLENSNIVAIVNTGDKRSCINDKEILYQAIVKQQQMTYNKYGFSFAAAVSNPVSSVSKLSETYFALKRYLSYSYVYGNAAVITHDLIKDNLQNTSLDYPFNDEQKLMSAIKEQNFNRVESCLEGILTTIKKMSYNDIIISLVHLTNSIDMFNINPVEYQTIDELKTILLEMIKNSFTEDISDGKQNRVVKAVKSMIFNEYTNPNLSLAGIAEKVKISPNYLNCFFKNLCGCSVSDFITDYRLSKAAELLETSDDNINVIMYKVGIENASTFYRCFKSKFGTTPKNFIVNRLCESMIENN